MKLGHVDGMSAENHLGLGVGGKIDGFVRGFDSNDFIVHVVK